MVTQKLTRVTQRWATPTRRWPSCQGSRSLRSNPSSDHFFCSSDFYRIGSTGNRITGIRFRTGSSGRRSRLSKESSLLSDPDISNFGFRTTRSVTRRSGFIISTKATLTARKSSSAFTDFPSGETNILTNINSLINFFCCTSLSLARTRWVWLSFSSLCPLSSNEDCWQISAT